MAILVKRPPEGILDDMFRLLAIVVQPEGIVVQLPEIDEAATCATIKSPATIFVGLFITTVPLALVAVCVSVGWYTGVGRAIYYPRKNIPRADQFIVKVSAEADCVEPRSMTPMSGDVALLPVYL